VFGFKVGKARGRYGINAPATTGNDVFERTFRVQQNTMEVLIIFVPGIYLFSRYLSPVAAASLGAIYLAGRELYASNYVKDPAKRGAGHAISFLPAVILLLGGLSGALWSLFKG
jgi:uncharacterized MAPEG superfamily protein